MTLGSIKTTPASQHSGRTGTSVSVEIYRDTPQLENVQTELEAARIRIKDLESEVRSNRDEMRSRAREGHRK